MKIPPACGKNKEQNNFKNSNSTTTKFVREKKEAKESLVIAVRYCHQMCACLFYFVLTEMPDSHVLILYLIFFTRANSI